jgi:hypothetical protein
MVPCVIHLPCSTTSISTDSMTRGSTVDAPLHPTASCRIPTSGLEHPFLFRIRASMVQAVVTGIRVAGTSQTTSLGLRCRMLVQHGSWRAVGMRITLRIAPPYIIHARISGGPAATVDFAHQYSLVPYPALLSGSPAIGVISA